MLEMYRGQANSPETSLANNISDTETTIYVLNGGVLPDAPSLLVIGGDSPTAETVLMVDKTIDMLTVQRGIEGTQKAWNSGTVIARNFTAEDHNRFIDNINELNDIKVDKVVGKGLSTNDYDNTEKAKVAEVDNKVDKVTGKVLSTNDFTNLYKAKVDEVDNKVDKVAGKGLSTNDFTDLDADKLDGIDWGAKLRLPATNLQVVQKTNNSVYLNPTNMDTILQDSAVRGSIAESMAASEWATGVISNSRIFITKTKDGLIVLNMAVVLDNNFPQGGKIGTLPIGFRPHTDSDVIAGFNEFYINAHYYKPSPIQNTNKITVKKNGDIFVDVYGPSTIDGKIDVYRAFVFGVIAFKEATL